MSYNHNNNEVNAEQIAAFLSDAVKNVKSASDVEIKAMDEIKKLFKKNVPFSLRKYVAAYLVKQSARGGRFKGGDRFNGKDRFKGNDRFNRNEFSSRSERSERSERAPREFNSERTERPPRVQIDPSLAKTIFIGIGKNRRVNARDLVNLLVMTGGIERERIGDIRILTNYSFVTLFAEDAEKAISSLSGYDYRGRKLSVSYSQKKTENADSPAEVSEEVIPANVSNEGHASEITEESKIASQQSAFAAEMAASPSEEVSVESKPYVEEEKAPYSETTDDGQVKSHFGDGAAY